MTEGIQNETVRSSLDIMHTNDLGVRCDQSMYGRPEAGSCDNAVSFIGLDPTEKAFRERHGSLQADFELPVTYISGLRPGALHDAGFAVLGLIRFLTDDAACSVNPSLQRGYSFGVAKPADIATAAHAIIKFCVIERGYGGVTTIGKQRLIQ